METAYLSPHRGATRPEARRVQTSAGKPAGGDLSPSPPPPPLPAGSSPEETPASGDGRRNSGVKKHHHKHNLKHRYELLETLGRGTYGKVKKAIERRSGREVSPLREVVNMGYGAISCSWSLWYLHSRFLSGPKRALCCTQRRVHIHSPLGIPPKLKRAHETRELWLHTPRPMQGLTTGCYSANPATDWLMGLQWPQWSSWTQANSPPVILTRPTHIFSVCVRHAVGLFGFYFTVWVWGSLHGSVYHLQFFYE